MLKVNPVNFNNVNQSWDQIWNDRKQKAHSHGINLKNQNCERQDCTRSRASTSWEAQQPTRVSAMRDQETELQRQLQNLLEENSRINALMNQIRITNDSMNNRNQGLAQQLQTSNLQLSRLQTEVSHLRLSVGGINLPNIETQKIFEISGKELIPWARKIFCNRHRLNKETFSLQEEDGTYSISLGRGAKCFELLELRCRRNIYNKCRILGYWSVGYRTHLWRHISVYTTSRAQFLLQH